MPEDSAYWEGTATGDVATNVAWDAPYTHSEWAAIKNYLLANSSGGGFVVPGYNNNLEVVASSPAAMTVEVSTGAMFIQGRIYENTAANVLTISTNATGLTRIDRIVIRVTYAAQTIRAVVLEGTPASLSALPSPLRNTTYYDVPIAYIWVVSGAVTVGDTDIHDERLFASNSLLFDNSAQSNNLLANSEFMSFSQLSGGATTNPPECWDLYNTPSDIAAYARPAQMSRGRSVQITANGASEGISQTVSIKPSTMYSIKLTTRVTSGDLGLITITTNSAAPNTISRYTRRTNSWIEETIYYLTEADVTSLTVILLAANSGDIVQYGQAMVVEGYIPGPFRKSHERILFTKAVTEALWAGTTKTNANYTVNLATHFQGLILEGSRACLLQLSGYDSVSATSLFRTADGPVIIYTYGLTENIVYTATGWKGLPEEHGSFFTLIYQSAPAASFVATAVILGIEI